MDENPYESPSPPDKANPKPWLRDMLTDIVVASLIFLGLAIPGIVIAWLIGAF